MKTKLKEWAPERFELDKLKRWKYASTKAKVLWLEDALKFGTKVKKRNSH
ncbi:hypothetical protein HZC20_01945 [Candidatus Peregrinibacteria bacterium]|nr:hypothetical protein [Candidatus Peregrinibacteria bacterium]